MNIIVLGTRGIPDIPGGIETHCQELYPLIASEGHKITVLNRSPYVRNKKLKKYNGVHLKNFYAPKSKYFEAIVHSFIGTIYAAIKRPDILHIHAVGPMLMTPLARILGLKVVVTNHGPDYKRQKWTKLAKTILITGERLGVNWANNVIVISNVIKKLLKERYGRKDVFLIYNGVNKPKLASNFNFINTLGLKKKQYVLAVGRFVEEKGFHDLIEAFIQLNNPWKLVLVGDSDHTTDYSRSLKEKAKKYNVILTGFIKGDNLNEIFTHSGLFVIPSYHEGLPIALLEAMSYELDVLVSDIPANKEVGLEPSNYFEVGNIQELYSKLESKINKNNKNFDYSAKLESEYNWDIIAKRTIAVYNDCLNK